MRGKKRDYDYLLFVIGIQFLTLMQSSVTPIPSGSQRLARIDLEILSERH